MHLARRSVLYATSKPCHQLSSLHPRRRAVAGDVNCADFIGRDQNITYGYSPEDVERLIAKVLAFLQAGAAFIPEDNTLRAEINGVAVILPQMVEVPGGAYPIGSADDNPDAVDWEKPRHTDGREYPWGDAFDRNRLNCAEFWSGEQDLSDYDEWGKWFESESYQAASTTAVGQFPGGDSQVGVKDMSGNVWEWTSSWYDVDQVYRAVRGGSWLYFRRFARCVYCGRNVPVNFFDNLGFRLVSPGSISDLWTPSPQMTRTGLEPVTKGLRVPCSAKLS